MASGAATTKSHHCHRCGRSFARHEHLQRHERSHTKEKPYRCLECTSAFTRKDLLTRHDRLCHSVATIQVSDHGSSTLLTRDGYEHSNDIQQTLAADGGGGPLTRLGQLAAVSSLQYSAGNGTKYPLTSSDAPQSWTASVPGLQQPDASTEDNYSDFYNADDFAAFLDTISLPTNPFSPMFVPLPKFSANLDPSTGTDTVQRHFRDACSGQGNARPPELWDSGLSHFASRLPSLQPEESTADSGLRSKTNRGPFGRISPECRDKASRKLATYANVISNDFVLPSRFALSRFIQGYVTGFHEHFPFLHLPTLSFETASIELLLAVAALGAQYCRERQNAVELFRVAKDIALERVRRLSSGSDENWNVPSQQHGLVFNSNLLMEHGTNSVTDFPGSSNTPSRLLETVQALLILNALGMWSEKRPAATEALSMRSVLDWLIRDERLVTLSERVPESWQDWVLVETTKRTKIIVFCFFNLHTIVFNVPPIMLTSELDVNLPCTEEEWKVEGVGEWLEARHSQQAEPAFQGAYESLFEKATPVPTFSSMGGYVLIHAVIQHIWILQQAARQPPRQSGALSLIEANAVEQALKRWRQGWERDMESSVSPLSPHGPLSFTSTALLRLAYIRTNIDSGSVRSLGTWDPQRIARSLFEGPPVRRSDKVTGAALHCAHGLSIPVKLGINFVAHTQVFFWSNQHALCSLECALLLSKWLEVVTVPVIQTPLTLEEKRVLDFVVQMVAETEYSVTAQQFPESSRHLAAIVVKVWAKLFRADSIWEMVDLIGRSLRAYAALLEGNVP